MQVSWPDFTPATFSFHDDPVLVVENCWTAVERRQFRDAMERSSWQLLHERAWRPRCLPQLRELAQRGAWPFRRSAGCSNGSLFPALSGSWRPSPGLSGAA